MLNPVLKVTETTTGRKVYIIAELYCQVLCLEENNLRYASDTQLENMLNRNLLRSHQQRFTILAFSTLPHTLHLL